MKKLANRIVLILLFISITGCFQKSDKSAPETGKVYQVQFKNEDGKTYQFHYASDIIYAGKYIYFKDSAGNHIKYRGNYLLKYDVGPNANN